MLPMMPVPVSHPARRRINRLETARPHPDSKPDDHQHKEPLQYLHLPMTRRPARRVRRPLLPLLLRHDEDSGRSQRDDEREKRRDYPCRPAHDGRWRSVVSRQPSVVSQVPGTSCPEMVYRVRTRRSKLCFAKLFLNFLNRVSSPLFQRKGQRKGQKGQTYVQEILEYAEDRRGRGGTWIRVFGQEAENRGESSSSLAVEFSRRVRLS